ncbi:MAG: type II toxin-antitoxin system VapC family toxin [Rhodoglobus sp.]
MLDASAVLALIYNEPGADEVMEYLDGSVISSVNFSEVLQKAASAGHNIADVATLLRQTVTGVVPLDDRLAVETAELWSSTRTAGLSLADRACLTLARAMSGVAITADRAWADLQLPGIAVHVIER